MPMNIKVEPHANEQAEKRGVKRGEIEDVLRTGKKVTAKYGRLAKEKTFPFQSRWQGKHYPQKRVRVVYVVEADMMVAITVFAFYGEWGET